MNKYVFPFLLLLQVVALNAQQLVLNGGHEWYTGKTGNGTYPPDTCRRELLTVGTIVPAFNLPNPPGIAAVCASPDHLCKDPFQGKAHGGLFFYPKIEIPQYQLCAPTIPGKKYFVSYQIKLEPGSYYAVDQVSTFFGQWGTECKTASAVVNPKHTTAKGDFLINESKYEKVSFEFVADSAYTAVMIGNFLTKSNPKGSDVKVVNAANPSKLAYYLLDEISVKPEVTIHGDTVVCSGGAIQIWLENNTSCNKSIVWKEKGKEAKLGLTDTLKLDLMETKTFLAIIQDDTLERTVKVINNGPLSLGPDTSYCDREVILLDAGVLPGASYKWQDGSSLSTFKVTKNGVYAVEMTIGGCISSDTVQVFLGNIALELGPDTLVCGKKNLLLNPKLAGNLGYFWQDSSKNSSFTAVQSGLYKVTVTSGKCTAIDSIQVEFAQADLDSAFKAPNVFSPNGDQVNDQFELIINTKVYQYELIVFDRFGNVVFRTNDHKAFWDGRVNNEFAPAEVYTWVCQLEVDACGKRSKATKKGEVLVLR